MEIQPISGSAINLLDSATQSNLLDKAERSDFADFINSSLSTVNQNLVESNEVIEKLALGKTENTHEVIIAIEKAKMSLQLASEVRNKLVEAYKEILRMQV
ncbi:MAG: flagellar hook-basal body complex protein FliE [Kangiellaceae bacterium]|nr:flagellar hook-basal body complex protein FliE [Kangiellaceae bacterium]MCW8997665.1 flagellar hook-basal body complex protein FliE [Kangiellaceae bacterium]